MSSVRSDDDAKLERPAATADPQLIQILQGYAEDKHADEFVSLMLNHVKDNEVNVLLCTWNHPWGIGDYVHNLDFAVYYEELVKSTPNIHINSLCFVPEIKIGLAVELRKGKLDDKESRVFNSKTTEFEPDIFKKRHIIWTNNDKNGVQFYDQAGEALLHHIQKQNQYSCIINISRSFAEDDATGMFYSCAAKSKIYMQSINEYGRWPITKEFMYDSIAMGVAAEAKQVGIKFNENIIELRKKNKNIVATSLEDGNLRIEIEDILNKEHSIGFGYVQDDESFSQFILATAAATETQHCDVFVNRANLDELNKNIKILQNLGFGVVEYKGEKIQIGKGEKTMKIKTFSNISQADKEKMIALSAFVAGSGDTSYTELLSSGKFPFFQSRPWKHCFFAGMLADIDTIPELKSGVLKQYIMMSLLLNPKNESEYTETMKKCGMELKFSEIPDITPQEYADFVKQNHQIILEQFQLYAKYAYQMHNVRSAQDDILTQSIIASVLNKGNKDELEQLLKVLPNWHMNHTSFVLYAALQNNISLLQQLYETNPIHFVQLLIETHPIAKSQPTALEHLIRQGNLAALHKMLNGEVITYDFLNFNLLKSSLEDFEIFLNKFKQANEDKSAVSTYLQSRDDKGNNPLHYAVESRDIVKIEHILKMAKELKIDLLVPNAEGVTPLDLAKNMHNNTIIKLLDPDVELSNQDEEKFSSTHFLLTELSIDTQAAPSLIIETDEEAPALHIETDANIEGSPPILEIEEGQSIPTSTASTTTLQEPSATDSDEGDSNEQEHRKLSK